VFYRNNKIEWSVSAINSAPVAKGLFGEVLMAFQGNISVLCDTAVIADGPHVGIWQKYRHGTNCAAKSSPWPSGTVL